LPTTSTTFKMNTRPHKPTIKDIAKDLGVSVSTVSRALRGMPDVNPQTLKSVLRHAEKIDYQPNMVALSLVKKQTHTIGVIVPNLDYFCSNAIRGIDEAALEAGYTVMICQSNESYGREVVNTQRLMSSSMDGLIVSLSNETNNVDHFKRLMQREIPIVFFDRTHFDLNASNVVLDNAFGGEQAAAHLIEQGCRKIAFIRSHATVSVSTLRENGYRTAHQKAGLTVDESLIVHCDFNQEAAYRATQQLLNRSTPDAIFTVSDRLALGAVSALKDRGLRIPEDVAIVGFNDEPIMSIMTPKLSSVTQPAFEMGRRAARMFIEHIHSEGKPEMETIIMRPQLMIRESSLKRGLK
jgi:DNA-binding LacI/PurR family transcriptional regulator